MSELEKVEAMIAGLPRGEKAQLLQWVANDLGESFPGIDSKPGVMGGAASIVRTRIPVWVLVQAHKMGASEIDLLKAYPHLRAEDLANAWAYYRSHRKEVDELIEANEQEEAA
ncbi:MAG: DUF433 domain-containing protein [Lewinellaceae bacterium]|nr:DUF433 domain-containing protein [Lewinellaceae bacterium]